VAAAGFKPFAATAFGFVIISFSVMVIMNNFFLFQFFLYTSCARNTFVNFCYTNIGSSSADFP
jgi:hypothetical protein